jgi:hypothetical protein
MVYSGQCTCQRGHFSHCTPTLPTCSEMDITPRSNRLPKAVDNLAAGGRIAPPTIAPKPALTTTTTTGWGGRRGHLCDPAVHSNRGPTRGGASGGAHNNLNTYPHPHRPAPPPPSVGNAGYIEAESDLDEQGAAPAPAPPFPPLPPTPSLPLSHASRALPPHDSPPASPSRQQLQVPAPHTAQSTPNRPTPTFATPPPSEHRPTHDGRGVEITEPCSWSPRHINIDVCPLSRPIARPVPSLFPHAFPISPSSRSPSLVLLLDSPYLPLLLEHFTLSCALSLSLSLSFVRIVTGVVRSFHPLQMNDSVLEKGWNESTSDPDKLNQSTMSTLVSDQRNSISMRSQVGLNLVSSSLAP